MKDCMVRRFVRFCTINQRICSKGSESDNNDSPDGHVDGRIASPELDPLDYFSDDDKKKDIEMGNLKRSASEDDEQVFMSADG